MSIKEILLICLVLLSPLYFITPFGVPLSSLTAIVCLPFLINGRVISYALRLGLGILLILAALQFFCLNLRYGYFFNKIMAIVLFYSVIAIVYTKFSDTIHFILKWSLYFVMLYSTFASVSYFFGYSDFLLSANCGDNNLSPIGHLRCGTFGEGNYFGHYLSLSALLFYRNRNILNLICCGALISFSPPAIISTFFINFIGRFKRPGRATLVLIILFLFAFLVSYRHIFDHVILALSSEMTSTSERLEFMSTSLMMFMANPLLGLGFGQYGDALPNYTDFAHLLSNSSDGIRYIPNNVFAETLSEQGILGFAALVPLLIKLFVTRPKIYNLSVPFFIIFVDFLTMPTLYMVYVAVLLGAIMANNKAADEA